MSKQPKSFVKRQRGQAMVETLIVSSAVLLPLFLAIPAIAKYMDMRTAAVQGARYAAWERTVWYGGAAASPLGWFGASNRWKANEKSDDEIRSEIAARLLSKSNTTNVASDAFRDNDKSLGAFRNGDSKLLWKTRDGSALLRTYGDTSGQIRNDAAPGTLNKVLDPIANLASTLGPFTLEMKGKYTATTTLDVNKVDFQTSFLALSEKWDLSESNTLVANGWNAAGPNDPARTSVTGQVKGLLPTSIFSTEGDGIGPTINKVVVGALSVFFPEFGKLGEWKNLNLGKVDPEVVPADRLKDKK